MDLCTDMCGCGTDHYGKGLLSEEVSRPFWLFEGINEGLYVLYSIKIGVWV